MNSTHLATPRRLFRRLAFVARRPLGLVIAGAGCGRSVLLREFVAADPSALLLELAAPHVGFRDLVRDLCEALREVAPGARLSFPSAYIRAAERRRAAPILARWLVHHLDGKRMAIVINGVDRLGADVALFAEFVEALVQQSDGNLRVLLGTDEDGDLPIPRWLANDLIVPPLRSEELRWTLDEAREAGRACGIANADVIDRAHAASQGRFFELLYAIRTGQIVEAGDEPGAIILRELRPDERAFLDRTCLFRSFDRPLLDALGLSLEPLLAAEQRFERLLVHRVGAAFRFDERVRRNVEALLRERSAVFEAVADASIDALERLDRAADALRLACSLNAEGHVRGLLHRHGLVLEDRGDVEAIDEAVILLSPHGDDAVVRLLRATRESRLGRADTAEAWFRQAIATAQTQSVAAEAAYRLARDLVRRERLDAVELLEPYVADPTLGNEQRALIGSLLAQTYVVARRSGDAQAVAGAALASIETMSASTQALVFVRAAYVELYAGDPHKAASYARSAAEIAHANDLYAIAFGAYSVLVNLSYESVGPSEALAHIDQLWDCAVRIGNLEFQLYAMTNAYDVSVERGDCDAIERLDRDLAEFDFYYSGTGSAHDSMLSSRALIAAWAGGFAHAFEMLAPSAADLGDADREALRHAELALYAGAARRTEAASSALRAVAETLARVERPTVYAARAAVIARLAATVSGLPFSAPIQSASPERIAPLERAADVMIGKLRGTSSDGDVIDALERLWATDWGGFAKLLAALPIAA